jgi:hypothetical protein
LPLHKTQFLLQRALKPHTVWIWRIRHLLPLTVLEPVELYYLRKPIPKYSLFTLVNIICYALITNSHMYASGKIGR